MAYIPKIYKHWFNGKVCHSLTTLFCHTFVATSESFYMPILIGHSLFILLCINTWVQVSLTPSFCCCFADIKYVLSLPCKGIISFCHDANVRPPFTQLTTIIRGDFNFHVIFLLTFFSYYFWQTSVQMLTSSCKMKAAESCLRWCGVFMKPVMIFSAIFTSSCYYFNFYYNWKIYYYFLLY